VFTDMESVSHDPSHDTRVLVKRYPLPIAVTQRGRDASTRRADGLEAIELEQAHTDHIPRVRLFPVVPRHEVDVTPR
jgi:hypothetical protein